MVTINLITDAKLDLTVEEGTVNMCEAIQQKEKRFMAIGKAEGIAEGKAEGIAEGKAKGIAEGKAKGIAEGIAKGRLEALVSLWKKSRLTLEEAAEEAGMTVEEFVKKTGVKPFTN